MNNNNNQGKGNNMNNNNNREIEELITEVEAENNGTYRESLIGTFVNEGRQSGLLESLLLVGTNIIVNDFSNNYTNYSNYENYDNNSLLRQTILNSFHDKPKYKNVLSEEGEKYLKEHIRGKFKWVLVVDLDEFLFTKNYPTIRDYINKMEIENPHITCITVPWTMFGSSGHEKQPKSVVDNFLYRDAIDTTFQEGRYAKSLFQSSHKFNIHIPSNVNNKNTTLNFIPNQKSMPTIPKNIKIVDKIRESRKVPFFRRV